jgi:hypothetical protein
MTLPAGSYTVKSSAKAICANSGSSNLGQVMVKGCAGTSSLPDAGTRLDAGGAAMCVAEGQVCTQLGAGSVPCCSSLYCKNASSTSTTGTCQRSEIAEAGTCGTQTVAGGDEGLTQSFNLGKVPAEFTFRWNTYSIPDRVVVFYGGSILYDSGCSGEDIGNAGSGSKSLLISGATSTITVNVSPNCTGNTTGTAWDFTVDCPK